MARECFGAFRGGWRLFLPGARRAGLVGWGRACFPNKTIHVHNCSVSISSRNCRIMLPDVTWASAPQGHHPLQGNFSRTVARNF